MSGWALQSSYLPGVAATKSPRRSPGFPGSACEASGFIFQERAEELLPSGGMGAATTVPVQGSQEKGPTVETQHSTDDDEPAEDAEESDDDVGHLLLNARERQAKALIWYEAFAFCAAFFILEQTHLRVHLVERHVDSERGVCPLRNGFAQVRLGTMSLVISCQHFIAACARSDRRNLSSKGVVQLGHRSELVHSALWWPLGSLHTPHRCGTEC